MEPRQQPKFFDVARPSQTNPSANSRPVIVGHQPMMVDPMVRGAANSVSSPEAITSSPTHLPFTGHTAKVLAISDQMKSEMALTLSESASINTAPSIPTGIGEVPPNIAAEVNAPKDIPLTPTETTQVPTTPPAAQTLAPMPDLSHMPHIPVSHNSAHGSGKFKHMLLWLVVAAALVSFGAFLAIDAGLVGSSVHLPFHIFSRQS